MSRAGCPTRPAMPVRSCAAMERSLGLTSAKVILQPHLASSMQYLPDPPADVEEVPAWRQMLPQVVEGHVELQSVVGIFDQPSVFPLCMAVVVLRDVVLGPSPVGMFGHGKKCWQAISLGFRQCPLPGGQCLRSHTSETRDLCRQFRCASSGLAKVTVISPFARSPFGMGNSLNCPSSLL